MPTFPVPTLTHAYRPSFFEDVFENYAYLAQFPRVLREVAPRRYARLKRKTPRACYLALYEECNKRFPMYELPYIEAKEIQSADAEELFASRIPFEVVGIDADEDNITSPAVALVLVYADRMSQQRAGHTWTPYSFEVLEDFEDVLDEWLPDAKIDELGLYHRPPRGRVWLKPWDYLYEMVMRVVGASHNVFVDTTVTAQHEMNMFTEWNKYEIEGLAAEWKKAQSIIQHADTLIRHIDAAPATRLPLLAGALRLDPAALKHITKPKRTPSTLAEIFMDESR